MTSRVLNRSSTVENRLDNLHLDDHEDRRTTANLKSSSSNLAAKRVDGGKVSSSRAS
jgi:hypothetical protein